MYCTKVRVQYVYNGPYDCPAWLRKYGSTDVCSMYQRTKVRKYFRTTYVRKYSIYTIILYSNMIDTFVHHLYYCNTFVRMKVVQLNYLPSEGTFKDNKIQKYFRTEVLSYESTSVLPHLDLFPYTCRATTT